jgi:hypothetical protein
LQVVVVQVVNMAEAEEQEVIEILLALKLLVVVHPQKAH